MRRVSLALLATLSALTACDPPAPQKYDTGQPAVDDDLDGYSVVEGDCNDQDAAINPSASEICDSLDNNCDDQIDEGVQQSWWADRDGDGFGDADSPDLTCGVPAGFSEDATDCDDADGGVYPGAPERCNDLDDDCDGTADEEPTDAPLWYLDGDGDGYAGDRLSLPACDPPEGYLPAAEDCDDADAGVYPGAVEECDGEDDDCDGTLDDGATDLQTFWADADADGFGDPDAPAAACALPAGHATNSADCDDGDPATYPGSQEVCGGGDEDCDGLIDDDDPGVAGRSTFYADDDGDGYGDLADDTDACVAPAGYVRDDTDCEDGDPLINSAATDACDGLDNDCTGLIDDGGLCPCDVFYDGGGTYLFCTDLLSWYDARANCQQYGYDLATINDAAEDGALHAEAVSYGNTASWHWWVGYTDELVEGSFGWAGGNGNSYNNWNSGEPNNFGSGEDCVLFAYSGNHWNDAACSQAQTSICERF